MKIIELIIKIWIRLWQIFSYCLFYRGYKIPDWRKYFWDQEIDRCLEFVHVPRNLFICPNKSVEIVWKLKRKVRFSRIVKEKMMEQFHSGIDKIYLPIVWTFTNKNLHHMSCFLIDCRRKLIIYTDVRYFWFNIEPFHS